MKKLLIVTMIAAMFSISGVASAVSIEPVLTSLPVAGEAQFDAYWPLASNDRAYVDWIVFGPGSYANSVYEDLMIGIFGIDEVQANNYSLPGCLYTYQVEARGNPTAYPDISDIEDLTIYFNTSYLISAGSYFADLDTWHNSTNFGNLSGEGEDGAASVVGTAFGPVWITTNITWDYDGGLDAGDESDIAWILANGPPAYVPAAVNNTAQTGGYVPAPVPEPASMLLLGVGLIGLAGRARKKFIA